MGVGEAPRYSDVPSGLVGCGPLRGAWAWGSGPTRQTKGLVVGADGPGIDGLRGGHDPTRRDRERCSVES